MAAPQSRNSRDTTLKSVTFDDSNVSLVRADIHSPSGSISSGHGISAKLKGKHPSPSSGKVSDQRLQQRTSSPKVSDVGSDREADKSLDLSKMFGSLGALDPYRVSTPQKVGTLPFVPRLDNPDQAVQTIGDSAMEEELPLSPIRATTPSLVPAPRSSIPSTSRRRHCSYVQDRMLDVESMSEEECHFLPVMSAGTSSPARRAGPSRLTGRLGGHQGRLLSSGDVSLTDVISRMTLLEQ